MLHVGRLRQAHSGELHGEGLSKLANRADTGAQRAVYVRVNLLQGALAFLRGEAPDALSLFRKAERLLQELTITEDDGIRVQTTMASLAKLPTVFKKGGSTAPGNASQVRV